MLFRIEFSVNVLVSLLLLFFIDVYQSLYYFCSYIFLTSLIRYFSRDGSGIKDFWLGIPKYAFSMFVSFVCTYGYYHITKSLYLSSKENKEKHKYFDFILNDMGFSFEINYDFIDCQINIYHSLSSDVFGLSPTSLLIFLNIISFVILIILKNFPKNKY